MPSCNADVRLCHSSVFGISGNLPNNLLLADSFAAGGLPVYMPDILNADAVPASAMNDPSLDLDGWFARHGPETTRPAIAKVVKTLREQGVTRIAAVAYCQSVLSSCGECHLLTLLTGLDQASVRARWSTSLSPATSSAPP